MMRSMLYVMVVGGWALVAFARANAADDAQPVVEPTAAVVWLDDYAAAHTQAKNEGKMLLIHFDQAGNDAATRELDEQVFVRDDIRKLMSDYVAVRVPMDASITVAQNPVRLLGHPSFRYMRGHSGLAIVDLKHADRDFYGHTVSCLPFVSPVYYAPRYSSPQAVKNLLRLPPGTVTQRTLVFAVLCHPEAPASINGVPNPELFEACRSHSTHQANIRLQGHHNWETRFQRIWNRIGGRSAPREVCAQSWGHEDLLEASFSCVWLWRQSSGHWRSVAANQPSFGYDMKRGSNGVWYATGIFGG